MAGKYTKQYSSSYQSLEAIWNVLRLYSSQEHPLSVREIYDILKETEDAPPSPQRLERLLSQGGRLINTLYPETELVPSYSTVDNRLQEILTYGGNTSHELICVASKRGRNGKVFVPYEDLEANSTDEEGQKNNVARRYYLKGPLTDGAWRFLSDFVRDYPGITRAQTEQLLAVLDLLTQPRRFQSLRCQTAKPARSAELLVIEQIDRAIRERRKILVTVGDYELEPCGGRWTPVLRAAGTRALAPYTLLWSDGRCWLVGKEQEPVSLRLDRILQAELLKETFTPPENIDPAEYRTNRLSSGRRDMVRLRCSPELLGEVVERLGQDARYSKSRTDGRLEVTAFIVPERVKSLALCRPEGIEVLEPEGLRQDILQTLRRGMEQYGP